MSTPIEFEKVSFEDARQALDAHITMTMDQEEGWRRKRAPQPAESLGEATVRWMSGLPLSLRPVALPRQFPRIANRIGELWKRPARCDEYLQQLLIDNRGGRKGFPPAVSMEISQLAAHYAKVYPYRHSIWDDVLKK